ncbi:hypothetical protein [Pseudoscardovia suis]|uniref:Phage protein n=1 Tax=Pseudoscardovia suis TaxID=987063 RepID=A0A261F113_9BIFI|nr:hypothetical protein [Pseudoscardovia suis]OZG52765.1 hypothetical protein PSSU_0383 [Pseudoscardovia suis]PJJ64940.1 hypothetical protein CLV65_1492 [Pseudoscardovia suis]
MKLIEVECCEWLNADKAIAWTCPAACVEPHAGTADGFTTVSRAGGSLEPWRDTATLTVKVTAPTLQDAGNWMMGLVLPRLEEMWGEPDIARVEVLSVYPNPDPGPPQRPRYQANMQVVRARA